MTTQHTPGPWYVGTEFADQGRHIYAAQKVRHEDGDEWHPLIACTDDDERLVNWQANAVLIAAAPDLLEALQELLATERANSLEIVGRDTDGHPLNAAGVARKKARAAIAKATGEQQ
jgi:hypothetical protein